MDTMLSRALRDFLSGPLKQLLVNISGKENSLWEKEFARFLRKEPCWIEKKEEGIVAPFDRQRIDIVSEAELRSFTFLSYSAHPTPDEEFIGTLGRPMSCAAPHAGESVTLRRLELKNSKTTFQRMDYALGRRAVFTDYEQFRALLASLILSQPNGREGWLLTDRVNRFLVVEGILSWSLAVTWRGAGGWRIHADDFTHAEAGDVFFVQPED